MRARARRARLCGTSGRARARTVLDSMPWRDRPGARQLHPAMLKSMQLRKKAGEVFAKALTRGLRQLGVILGLDLPAFQFQMARKERRALVKLQIRHGERKGRARDRKNGGLAAQRRARGLVARKLEDELAIDIDGGRIPTVRDELECARHEVGKGAQDRGAEFFEFNFRHVLCAGRRDWPSHDLKQQCVSLTLFAFFHLRVYPFLRDPR